MCRQQTKWPEVRPENAEEPRGRALAVFEEAMRLAVPFIASSGEDVGTEGAKERERERTREGARGRRRRR